MKCMVAIATVTQFASLKETEWVFIASTVIKQHAIDRSFEAVWHLLLIIATNAVLYNCKLRMVNGPDLYRIGWLTDWKSVEWHDREWHDRESHDPLIYLGYPVPFCQEHINTYLDTLLTKIQSSANIISQRFLSVLEKSVILNSVILSRL
ncbi:MAG: hypothetical protein BYD32DRAFT_123156 [Podila humilis]|nr:MAG: hypothetical protein BYD32DRAFT_123156 [Podila humilis]